MEWSFQRAPSAFILTSILIALVALPIYAQEATPLTVELAHRVAVTETGFIAVNETIRLFNSGPASTPLPTLELKYDSISAEAITAYAAKGPVGFDFKKEAVDSTVKMIVSPKTPYSIQAGYTESLQIQLYLSGLVTTEDGVKFNATIPAVPSMNYLVKEMRLSVLLPPGARLTGEFPGFGFERLGESEFWSSVSFNVTAAEMSSRVLGYTADEQNPPSILRFPTVKRTLTVSADGSVTVKEDIQVLNIGKKPLSKLPLSLLDEKATKVVVTPATEPPLINTFTATLTDNKLDLKEAYGLPLPKGGRLNIRLEYPLPAEYSSSKDGSIFFKIPMSPPVRGVVEQFEVGVAAAPGISTSYTRAQAMNVAPISDEVYSFEATPSVVWTSSGIITTATVIFIAVLVTLLFGRITLKGAEKEGREAPVKIGDLLSAFEEKTVSVASMLDSLISGRSVSRGDVSKSRGELEALKSKVASRLGEMKPKVLSLRADLKERLADLSSVDREYNRASSDLLNICEQYSAGRVRRRTFEELVRSHRRRLDQARDRLMEIVEQIDREIQK